ncbi:MAG: aspartate aminotransferase family protein [Verrucomicrobiae bacterium]|nr:aspartate aminotransferase family protein [Verrucomicrobiae bacterium]
MRTRETLRQLRLYESPNVTHLDPDGRWPIVWDRARGCAVWDPEGRRYLDLTAAFGVAAAGHANPAVVRAGQRQLRRLPHAMGDVHPHPLKASLARVLSGLTFERWSGRRLTGRTVFTNSGFESVEAALKTARLATGRPGIIAFEGAYHGLGYGALEATHREHFRGPFRDQLGKFGTFVPWPACSTAACSCPANPACADLPRVEAAMHDAFARHAIGAILVEPVQARGGIRIPSPQFLPWLRRVADAHGALLIVDEIYTGFGRTGRWFACEHSGVMPDLVCLGKALAGGFPISACVGRAELMEAAWPRSEGEAIHTSTFLGNPVGCAMALAQIAELRRQRLIPRSASLGRHLLKSLRELPARIGRLELTVRGLGLMAGVELRHADGRPAGAESLAAIQSLLHQGYILLPEGPGAEVISFSPPLVIRRPALDRAVSALKQILREVAA